MNDTKIVVVTTLYNCENYIIKCLESIKSQCYDNFVCYICNDISTDKSVDLVNDFIKNDNRFILINNTAKLYQGGNYDNVIRNNTNIDDTDIIVEVDGDDWLPDDTVFNRVMGVYSDKNVWIAYGNFMFLHDNSVGFASPPPDFNNIRRSVFTASHLRTWRAFLWRHIRQEDLKDGDRGYYKAAPDVSFMWPMLEMAGPEHFKYMKNINYVYNDMNPLNEPRVCMNEIMRVTELHRYKPSYQKLNL